MTVEIFQGIKHHFTEKGQQRHCGLLKPMGLFSKN